MISKDCRIESFVDLVKDKAPDAVIAFALTEATEADRLLIKQRQADDRQALQTYSRQLKQLINYHRYVVKPRRRVRTTYDLYMKYWGAPEIDAQVCGSAGAPRRESSGQASPRRRSDRAGLERCAAGIARRHRAEQSASAAPVGLPSVWKTLLKELRKACPGFSDIEYGIALNRAFVDPDPTLRPEDRTPSDGLALGLEDTDS